jgi:hypothetical protein
MALVFVTGASIGASADTLQFGDRDLLNTGAYGSDPTAGAALQGLSPGAVSFGSTSFVHGFPFTPAAGDFAGTDQIYTGSTQTFADDGYSTFAERLSGPQVLTLDYGSLVDAANPIGTFTLGIMADDFQAAFFGQPFVARINGVIDANLTSVLNSLNLGGPSARFLSVGLDPSALGADHVLTLSIDEGGDGGDGWAIDFLTVGVTSAANVTPLPTTATAAMSLLGLVALRRRLRRNV